MSVFDVLVLIAVSGCAFVAWIAAMITGQWSGSDVPKSRHAIAWYVGSLAMVEVVALAAWCAGRYWSP